MCHLCEKNEECNNPSTTKAYKGFSSLSNLESEDEPSSTRIRQQSYIVF